MTSAASCVPPRVEADRNKEAEKRTHLRKQKDTESETFFLPSCFCQFFCAMTSAASCVAPRVEADRNKGGRKKTQVEKRP